MIKTILTILALASIPLHAAEPAAEKAPATAAVCAQDGKAVKAGIQFCYEDVCYPFCSEECKAAFEKKVTSSIYHQIGGKAAMEAAVGIFYKKVLADKRINHFFEGVNMKRQAEKQKAFLSAAFGSPVKWTGLDMRTAHADLTGLNDSHFDAVAGNLKETLEELKVKPELVDQIMTLAGSLRDEVLNRKKAK